MLAGKPHRLSQCPTPPPLSPEAGQSHQDEAERPAPWQLALYFRGSDVATVPPIVGKQGFFLTGRYLACLQPLLLASYILRTSRKGAKLKPSYTSAHASQSRGGTEPPSRGRSYGHRGGHHAPTNEALQFESMPLFDLIRPLARLRARSICFRGKIVGARHGAERSGHGAERIMGRNAARLGLRNSV